MTIETAWHILLVDDDEDDYLLTREMLSMARREKFRIDWTATYAAGRAALLEKRYDAALIDYDMGARSGIELIREVIAAGCTTPLIVFTGRGTYEIDVAAMQAGAADYLSKGETNPALLERAIRFAIERKRHEQELAAANEALSATNAQIAAGRQELSEILGSIRDGFFSLDSEWRFVYVNQVAAQRSGLEPADMIGKTIWEIYPQMLGTPLWERYHAVMETRQPENFEVQGVVNTSATYEVRIFPTRTGISVYWIDITEQKANADALNRERELLQKVFDNLPVLVNIYQPNNPVPQVNPFFTAATGWTADDIAGSDLMRLCYPDPEYRAGVQQVMDDLTPGWHDCRITTRSGAVLETSWTNMRLSDGTHVGIGIDISERKQAEADLRARHEAMAERIRLIEGAFENAPAGLAVFEPRPPYRIIAYNQQFQGYTPEPFNTRSLVGVALSEFFPPANDPNLAAIFDRVVNSGTAYVMTETPFDGLPAGRSWWNWSLAPIRAGERTTGLALLAIDVTSAVETRAVLDSERAFLTTVLEQLPSAVMIFDAEQNHVILANRQVERDLRIALPPDDRRSGYAALSRFFASESAGSGLPPDRWPFFRALREGTVIHDEEITILRGDGTQGIFSISASPIVNTEGRVVAAVAVFEDVTERRRAGRDTAFLIALGESLNLQENAGAILPHVSRSLVQHLDAHRCLFFTVDQQAGTTVLAGSQSEANLAGRSGYGLEELPPEVIASLTAGKTVPVRDARADPRTAGFFSHPHWPQDLRSYVAVPLMRGGSWAATMLLSDTRPRKWNDRQVAFLQAVAERVWYAYETQRLMEALRENQERYRSLAEDAQLNLKKLEVIFDNLTEAVFISNLDGRFLRINPAGLALHGFSSEEEMKGDLSTIFNLVEVRSPDGSPIPHSERPVVRAARGETVINMEMHARRRDTGKQWIGLYSSLPIRDENGEVLFILSTVIDITHIREAEIQRGQMSAAIQTQHLLVAQREEERIQIARDIHDGPLQDLIALTYTLQSAVQGHTSPDSTLALDNLRARSQKLVSDLRGVCNELRPPLLARFGLAKAIRSHAEDLQTAEPGLAIDLDLDEDGEALPMNARLALYRIYQESVRNIMRHAGAARCAVRLRLDESATTLEVEDNGRGFELPSDWITLAREGHLGLVGIKERAEAVGGRLELNSCPGSGTLVRVTLPRA